MNTSVAFSSSFLLGALHALEPSHDKSFLAAYTIGKKIDKKHIETTCEGGDEINIGFLNENWKFYDKNGTQIKPTEKEIKEIEESGIVDEFDVMGK